MKTRTAALMLALLAAQACSDGATTARPPGAGADPRAAARPRELQGLPPDALPRVGEQHARLRRRRPGVRRDEPARPARDQRRARRLLRRLPRADGGAREGATTDGSADLDEVPKHLQGVTCYFCHNAVGVGEHFNNDLELADDNVMRGGIREPRAHHARTAPSTRASTTATSPRARHVRQLPRRGHARSACTSSARSPEYKASLSPRSRRTAASRPARAATWTGARAWQRRTRNAMSPSARSTSTCGRASTWRSTEFPDRSAAARG